MSIFSQYYQDDLSNFFKSTTNNDTSALKFPLQKSKNKKYDYILIENAFAYTDDVQSYIKNTKRFCHPKTRVVVVYFNFLWKPLLNLATSVGLKKKDEKEPNWLTSDDILNLFTLEGFTQIKKGRRLLMPISLGFLSKLINKFVAQFPLINSLCLTTYQIFRLNPSIREFSTSLIIPARNEEGNIKGILSKLPQLGKSLEVIFVEGHSEDNTYYAIRREIKENKKEIKAYLLKQKGKGKADAVRLGFKKARNEILIILDADLSVDPKDLEKFYRALAEGHGEFANGSRLVYPMEKQAMRTLNYIGNKVFGTLFSFLLDQKVKDTLCGTKALFRNDYLRIVKNRKIFGDFDPFGDFDLLFGATKLNLKIVEVPVRYKERRYGKTNISRFTHGWLLLKMILIAAKKLKFI